MDVCVGLHPDAMVTESNAMGSENSFIVFHGRLTTQNLRLIRDSRLFGCIIENPLISLSGMFVVQTSLRLLGRSVRNLLLEPTLFQGGETPFCACTDTHRLIVYINPNWIRVGRRKNAGSDPATPFWFRVFKAKLLHLTVGFHLLSGDRISIDDEFNVNVGLTRFIGRGGQRERTIICFLEVH